MYMYICIYIYIIIFRIHLSVYCYNLLPVMYVNIFKRCSITDRMAERVEIVGYSYVSKNHNVGFDMVTLLLKVAIYSILLRNYN